jgi:mRNA-degrading endonuclease RelE of RelBE toxin-antitoxin system
MSVTVKITDEALDQINELPAPIRVRMGRLAKRLEQWPDVSGTKPLRGELAGRYRLRTGDYRLQFRVKRVKAEGADAETITVIIEKAGHRDGFYED